MSDSPPHARTFEYEECVARIRSRLRLFVRTDGPVPWGFALYQRRGVDARMLSTRVLGFVTLTDSGALTTALVTRLPRSIRLEHATVPVELVSITQEPELLHEPLPGVVLRFRDGTLIGTKALSPQNLPPLGIVFLTCGGERPHGWPP